MKWSDTKSAIDVVIGQWITMDGDVGSPGLVVGKQFSSGGDMVHLKLKLRPTQPCKTVGLWVRADTAITVHSGN